MKKVKGYWLLIVLVVGLTVSGCTQAAAPPTGEETAPPAGEETASPAGVTKKFTIEGSEYKFSPASITVNKGDTVRITFKHVGSFSAMLPHVFAIPDLGVSSKVIEAGSLDFIEFTASESGTFAFICSIEGHREAGMEGELIVK